MNERIKKLAEQAGCYQETDYDGKLFWAMPEDSWEKFAELIRADEREACLQICIDAQEIEIYEAENDFEKGQITMAEYLQSAIKERGKNND